MSISRWKRRPWNIAQFSLSRRPPTVRYRLLHPAGARAEIPKKHPRAGGCIRYPSMIYSFRLPRGKKTRFHVIERRSFLPKAVEDGAVVRAPEAKVPRFLVPGSPGFSRFGSLPTSGRHPSRPESHAGKTANACRPGQAAGPA